jgi:hypothetical protein
MRVMLGRGVDMEAATLMRGTFHGMDAAELISRLVLDVLFASPARSGRGLPLYMSGVLDARLSMFL